MPDSVLQNEMVAKRLDALISSIESAAAGAVQGDDSRYPARVLINANHWADVKARASDLVRLLASMGGVRQVLQVGDVLGRKVESFDEDGQSEFDGFCGGEFGRDSYDLKKVEKIERDYIVLRTESGAPILYDGDGSDLVSYVLSPEDAKRVWFER